MTDRWVTSTNPESFSGAFWERHKSAISHGGFWADEIKSVRGEPAKRLKVAFDNLPLPSAFREAAIALRAMIRELRKREEPYEREVALLYWLAAVASFERPYSQLLQEPGYNVLETIPGQTVADLRFDYATLGYKELELLNKTDVKWITEKWGEPECHSTLNKLHSAVWDAAEKKLKEKRVQERRRFDEDLERILRG